MKRVLFAWLGLTIMVVWVIAATIPVDVLSVPPEVSFAKFGQNANGLLALPRGTGEMIVSLMFWAIALCFYFVPTWIALVREKRNTPAIFALNLLVGWTLVGWVAAIVWALTIDANPRPQPSQPATP